MLEVEHDPPTNIHPWPSRDAVSGVCLMISAKEALQASNEIKSAEEKEQLEDVELRVQQAIDEGRTSCHLSFQPLPAVRRKLEGLGYKVESDSQYNQFYCDISWGDS